MEKKEIKIQWQGKEEIVTVKKLTFGERNDLLEEVMDVKYTGNIPNVRVRHGKLKEVTILRSIVTAPFPTDIGAIRNLSPQIGDLLYEEIDKFNALTEAKKSD